MCLNNAVYMSLEELLLLEVESLEQVRVIDELVSHRLVEIQEHKGNVLADVLLYLADPLGTIRHCFTVGGCIGSRRKR